VTATLIVIAKAPVAGHAKTRLCPPCTPEQASEVAEAALADTLDAVAAVPATRRVLALAGAPGRWLPGGFEIVPQRGRGLDERLAAAFADAGAPALLVGMDTPQVRPALLAGAMRTLASPSVDAVLGRAHDGGYWAIGLRRADPAVFHGVPMSDPGTGAAQRARLDALGLRTIELAPLRDVDHFADATAVAAQVPGSRFAAAVGLVADGFADERAAGMHA
jgi:rSAM/selenodomain-associated transferase 1